MWASNAITLSEVEDLLLGVMDEEEVMAWWARANPRLPDGLSPKDSWEEGYEEEVYALAEALAEED